MKKFILIALVTIFLSLPFSTSVMAADRDVLRGKLFISELNKVSNISYITDGDLDTVATWSLADTLTYIFDEPIDIDYGSIVSKSSIGVSFRFYDVNGVNIYQGNFYNGTRELPPLKGISKLYLWGDKGAVVSDYRLYVYDQNPDSDKFIINNLKHVLNSQGNLSVSWDAIQSTYFKNYNIYKDGILMGTATQPLVTLSDLVPGQTYEISVSAVDVIGEEFVESSFSYTAALPDTTPPPKPLGLSVQPDVYYADLTWTKDTVTTDLAGYYVYLNGARVGNLQTNANYRLTGLKLATSYKVYVVAVDETGNLSEQSDEITFTTEDLAVVPSDPILSGTAFTSSVNLTWLPSQYAESYKVYQDGNFLSTTNKTSYKVSNLENGRSYEFNIVAVNAIGESQSSNLIALLPEVGLLPDVTMNYGLKDVADSSSYWFTSIWLILAFSISIPLAFYLANRIKGLFVS